MSNIDKPKHYNIGKIEVIDFIEDQQLDFHLGNAIKYICRAGRKSEKTEIEDLQKAQWYIARRLLKLIEVKKTEVKKKEIDKSFSLIACPSCRRWTTNYITDIIECEYCFERFNKREIKCELG